MATQRSARAQWVSRLAALAGLVMLIAAVIVGLMGTKVLGAAPNNLIQGSISAFAFAVWVHLDGLG